MAPMTEPMRPTVWKLCTLSVWYFHRLSQETADEGADDAKRRWCR